MLAYVLPTEDSFALRLMQPCLSLSSWHGKDGQESLTGLRCVQSIPNHWDVSHLKVDPHAQKDAASVHVQMLSQCMW